MVIIRSSCIWNISCHLTGMLFCTATQIADRFSWVVVLVWSEAVGQKSSGIAETKKVLRKIWAFVCTYTNAHTSNNSLLALNLLPASKVCSSSRCNFVTASPTNASFSGGWGRVSHVQLPILLIFLTISGTRGLMSAVTSLRCQRGFPVSKITFPPVARGALPTVGLPNPTPAL